VGRIRQTIRVDGHECWTLFDTGARHTYVVPSVARLLKTTPTPQTIRARLGGEIKETNTEANLHAEIEGHKVSTLALVIENIGRDESGKPIEILFGALAMQLWGIRPVPDEERLDLTHYPEEFVEF
jgi:Aspartyl protease